MKFCMITTFFPPYNFGGDGIFIYRLVNELAKRGHQVDVVHCEDAYLLLQPKGPQGDFPCHENVRIHKLRSRFGFLSPLLTQQTGSPGFKSRALSDILDNSHYDVIHFHNMSLIGITALRYGSAVKLYTTHEHWLVCPMHVLWKNNKELCAEKSCFSCTLAWKRPPQLWRYTGLLQRMLREVDHFISPSRFTKQKHMAQGLDIPITHIPYFLPRRPSADCSPCEAGSASTGSHEFLFVGRLEKIKGVQDLIPLFRRRPTYRLSIAGDGTYAAELKEMAKGIQNIRFLGRCSHAQLSALYRKANAVIVPSICYEVFGIIIIEAFSYKTPVIVNNLGALPEVVHDSGGGIVYTGEGELERAVDTLAHNHELRDRLGQQGFEAYLKYWTEEYHCELYFELIDQIRKAKGLNLPGVVR